LSSALTIRWRSCVRSVLPVGNPRRALCLHCTVYHAGELTVTFIADLRAGSMWSQGEWVAQDALAAGPICEGAGELDGVDADVFATGAGAIVATGRPAELAKEMLRWNDRRGQGWRRPALGADQSRVPSGTSSPSSVSTARRPRGAR
jgi:hypothetical protein